MNDEQCYRQMLEEQQRTEAERTATEDAAREESKAANAGPDKAP